MDALHAVVVVLIGGEDITGKSLTNMLNTREVSVVKLMTPCSLSEFQISSLKMENVVVMDAAQLSSNPQTKRILSLELKVSLEQRKFMTKFVTSLL
jgi:hypothetical protein